MLWFSVAAHRDRRRKQGRSTTADPGVDAQLEAERNGGGGGGGGGGDDDNADGRGARFIAAATLILNNGGAGALRAALAADTTLADYRLPRDGAVGGGATDRLLAPLRNGRLWPDSDRFAYHLLLSRSQGYRCFRCE